ncbi:hypothetical protein [Nocardia sp. N2S4-5]|uniref:hypothetical protein n=1 Tax=Nocardia sp. N2S4-5 TaxID=3351565 RepID=UPI0037D6F5E3
MAAGTNDYLSLLPSTLQWVSGKLDALSPIPWPLWIGGLFPIYVAAVSGALWFWRGFFWPVHCAYPHTSKGWPCRNWVAGEWSRCRHHNRPFKYQFGHQVEVKLQRWQTVKRGKIIDSPRRGVGVLRLRPAGSTLLYEKGFARTPGGVLKLLPTKGKEGIRRLQEARLRASEQPNEPAESGSAEKAREPLAQRTDIAQGLEYVVRATQFATVAFSVALGLTIPAIVVHDPVRTVLQYLATLGFVLAWAATDSGIYRRRSDWLKGACQKSLKWWLWVFLPVGVANLFFAVANKSPT